MTRVRAEAGWVTAGDIIYCDVCGRRCWVWELHHLIPVAWGGDDSRAATDHQVIWVRACGDCHATIHMVLDKARASGGWPAAFIEESQVPHLVVEAARRGWNAWRRQTPEGVT